MKKLVSMALAMLLMVTQVFASAEIPAFLTEVYPNYTADYSVSVTFESGEDLALLLAELEMPEEINAFIDTQALLQTLLSYEGKMTLQADISENYEKIKMGLTMESNQTLAVNTNLNVGWQAKTGLWLNMDLTDEENPVLDIICAMPFLNKYFAMDMTEMLPPEEIGVLKTYLNEVYIKAANTVSMELFAKHVTISGSGSKYTITMDNEGLTGYIDELMPAMSGLMAPLTGAEAAAFPSTKGWQILGEDGIQCVYTLKGGKLSVGEVTADFAIDLSQIYTATTGEVWPYTAADRLDFTVAVATKMSNIGSTPVEFPVLTEENSISLEDFIPEDSYTDVEAEPEPEEMYPAWYVGESCSNLPVVDGEIYVPLRLTMEAAYGDGAAIGYNNGVVTVTSAYFSDLQTLTVTIGADKTYADGKEYMVGKALLIDGTTYVSNRLFCDILGWEFIQADHNLIENNYYYAFFTAE